MIKCARGQKWLRPTNCSPFLLPPAKPRVNGQTISLIATMNESGNNNRQSAAGSLLKMELYAYCRSDSLSEEGLRHIIERHGLTPPNNNNPHISDYVFFLEACRNERVTEEILEYLLEYFP